MMLTAVTASAQFYTLTKEAGLNGKPIIIEKETPEIKEDTIEVPASAQSPDIENANEENPGQTVLNARKSDDCKSSQIWPTRGGVVTDNNDTISKNSSAVDTTNSLPELTIPNLLAEIKKNNIKYPKIVLAQAILETGWFKSSVCRNKHNLFGLTNPRTGKYYEFNHWTESVSAYKSKVQYKYSGGNYLLWLDKIGYAEEKTYVRALIKVLKQL